MTKDFVSLTNIKACEAAFHAYMRNKYTVDFDDAQRVQLRQRLYQVMTDLDSRYLSTGSGVSASGSEKLTIRDKNNLALNIMRDIVMASSNTNNNTSFEANTVTPPPPPNNNNNNRRKQEMRRRGQDHLLLSRETDLYGSRSVVEIDDRLLPSATAEDRCDEVHDAFEMAQALSDMEMIPKSQPPPQQLHATKEISLNPADFDMKLDTLVKERIPSSHHHNAVVATRCIALHGMDRDPLSFPYRYRFSVRTTGYDDNALQGTYKNIEWMSAERVVIPMDIGSERVVKPRPYVYGYDFSYPYVALYIDGFDGLYDGTNGTIRRCFCLLVYDRSYRASNGRGYVVLKPASADNKRIFNTPLASLRDLCVSLIKPNGTLLNNSLDVLSIESLVYETSNGLFMRLVTNKYFDLNEFFVGDVVVIRSLNCGGGAGAAVDQYINRKEGHEVVKLGDANDQGFLKSFYILAPGILDNVEGTIVLDEAIVGDVRALAGAPVNTSGVVLNMSLQALVTMTVGLKEHGLSDDVMPMTFTRASEL